MKHPLLTFDEKEHDFSINGCSIRQLKSKL
jgi:hypothetical protein